MKEQIDGQDIFQNLTITFQQCVVPDNINTLPMEENWKFQGESDLKDENL